MSVQANLLPTHNKKTLGAMKPERTVKRITFGRSEGETLYVSMPKLNVGEVLAAGSLALLFGIDLTGGTPTTSSCKTSHVPWSRSWL